MKNLTISLLFLAITACTYNNTDVAQDDTSDVMTDVDACVGVPPVPDAALPDARVSDAQMLDAVPLPPDAAVQLCPHRTKGLLIGDSIMVGIYKNRLPITSKGHTVLTNAVAGHDIGNQFAVWLDSPYRGDQSIDWIFIQIGINDVLHDITTVPQYLALMRVFMADIKVRNPNAVIFFGKITPAKARFDEITATAGHDRYQMWLDTNAGYTGIAPVMSDISDALNDGADSLLPRYAYTDRLHLSTDGYTYAATILEGKVEATFPPVPCQ